jgi:hypothetical protein
LDGFLIVFGGLCIFGWVNEFEWVRTAMLCCEVSEFHFCCSHSRLCV